MTAAPGIPLAEPAPFVRGQCVRLVIDVQHRHIGRANLFQDAPHRRHVAVALGTGGVDDVQRQVRLGHFFEGGAERRDQRMRQPIDEADGIRQEQLAAVGQPDLAQQRIEGDEQRIGCDRRSFVSRLNSVVLPALV